MLARYLHMRSSSLDTSAAHVGSSCPTKPNDFTAETVKDVGVDKSVSTEREICETWGSFLDTDKVLEKMQVRFSACCCARSMAADFSEMKYIETVFVGGDSWCCLA